MTIKRILILILAVLSISLTTNAQTLSKERKEKYQSKPSTHKKQEKRTNKKVAKSLKKHPLTINKEDEGTYTASTDMVYKDYLPKPTLSTPAIPTTIPTTGTIIYTAPNVGLGVLTIQPYKSGWSTLGTVSPSFSYSIGIGEYSTNTDGSLDIQPYLNIGAFAAVGYIPTANSASVQIGGALGIYKYTNVAIGYDLVTHKPFVGVGAAISISTFKKGLGSTILDTF
jgi:hypothetical protein